MQQFLCGGQLVADEGEDAPPVVVVNQAFAAHHWPGESPIGRRIAFTGNNPTWVEVIGLTQDVKHYGLDQEMRPGVYFLYSRNPSAGVSLMIERIAPSAPSDANSRLTTRPVPTTSGSMSNFSTGKL